MSASVAESQLIGSILHDEHDADEQQQHIAPLPASRAFMLGGSHSHHPPIQRSTSAPPQLADDDSRNLTFIAALKAAAANNSNGGASATSPHHAGTAAGGEQPAVEAAESGTVVVNGETVAANDPRLSPEYYAYYYLQRPLDPRLPPPLFNWSNWHYANSNKLNDPKRANEQFATAGASEESAPLQSAHMDEAQPPVEQKVQYERKEQQQKVEPRLSESGFSESNSAAASQRAVDSPAPASQAQSANGRPAAAYTAMSNAVDVSYISSSPSYPPHAHYLSASTAAYLTMSPTSSPLTEPLDSYEPLKHFQTLNLADSDLPFTAAPSPPFTAVPAFMSGLPGGPAVLSPSFRAAGNGMGGSTVSPMMAVMGFGALAAQQAAAAAATFQPSSHSRNSAALTSPFLHAQLDRSVPAPGMFKAALSPISLPMSVPQQQQQQQQLEQYGQLNQQFNLNMHFNMNMSSVPYGSPQLGPQQHQQQQSRRGSAQYWDSPPMAGVPNHPRGRDAFNHNQSHYQQRAHFNGKAAQRPYNNSHHNNASQQYDERGSPLAFGLNPALSPSMMSMPPKFLSPAALPVASAHTAWLDDFRLNKSNSHLTLFDITARGLLLDLSCDQFGSRFIQQRLETASSEEKEAAFAAVVSDVFRLSEDVFGNYVVQKLLEHGSVEQRRLLGLALSGHAFELSMHMYGCRVVQKCLDVCEPELQAVLIRELNGHVMQLVRDSNGNHVVQKCIERCPPHVILFIVEAFTNQVAALSTHPYGCRVVQRLLEHTGDAHRLNILAEVMRGVDELCKNSYGNYVVQHVLIHGQAEHRAAIVRSVRGRLLQLSKHKFASNVVEKCFGHASAVDRDALIDEVLGGRADGGAAVVESNSVLLSMVKDQFGNYVIQRLIDVLDDEQMQSLTQRIRRYVPSLRKIPYGRHILAKIEKITGQQL